MRPQTLHGHFRTGSISQTSAVPTTSACLDLSRNDYVPPERLPYLQGIFQVTRLGNNDANCQLVQLIVLGTSAAVGRGRGKAPQQDVRGGDDEEGLGCVGQSPKHAADGAEEGGASLVAARQNGSHHHPRDGIRDHVQQRLLVLLPQFLRMQVREHLQSPMDLTIHSSCC